MFVNQIMYVFGNISILSGPVNSTDYRKLICVSKDDGSALVWINTLNYNTITESSKQIYNSNKYINNEIDCKMNRKDEECLKSWSKPKWSFTSSLETPMGPVFDERWEDFMEYEIKRNEYHFIDSNTSTIVFSFLRYKFMQILFCNNGEDSMHYCHRLIITVFGRDIIYTIETCEGKSYEDLLQTLSPKCKRATSYGSNHNSNWHTITIIRNPMTQSIFFYNTDDVDMTYENINKQNETMNFLFSTTFYYRIYFGSIFFSAKSQSTSLGKIRFHIYDFLHTTLKDAILTSPIFTIYNQTICLEMLIGLCAECDANIILLDSANDIILKNVTIKGLTAKHGLPMWQSVQIKENLTTAYYVNVSMQLIPKLSTFTSNPLWAIANVRQCPQNGTLKAVVLHQKMDFSYIKKNVQDSPIECQKLFYDEQIYLSSWSNLTIKPEDCPRGKIGPQCLISCEHDLQINADCENITFCNNNGCTCPLGYWDISCRRRLEKPNVPKVIFVDTTSIIVFLPTTWNYTSYYEETTISYSFEIRELDEPETHSIGQSKKEIFQNRIQLIGHFKNLKPCMEYEIRCTLRIPGYKKHSDSITVWTHCMEEPNVPEVLFVNMTSIVVFLLTTWHYTSYYEMTAISYLFEFRGPETHFFGEPKKEIFQNTTQLIEHYENLKPCTEYEIRCTSRILGYEKRSDSITVWTKCLEKPNVPEIIFVNTTSIVIVVLPTTLNYTSYYEETAISYSFEIRGPETHSIGQSKKEIFQNTTQLIGQFENLKPCTDYEIYCTSRILGHEKHSDSIKVWTECLEKPNVPEIIFVNTTSIVIVVLPTTLNYTSYYEKTAISYSFEIRGPETHSIGQSKKEIFQNTTQLIGHFENLKPCTGYEIRCTSRIPGHEKHSDSITVWTHCDNKSTTIFKIYNIFWFLLHILCFMYLSN
ncbi:uncharacterized protein LOC114934077 isoform X2 [Nylanderia fulva]|nr:uncharacterized protein LOC114934077 isoform X2 [Nylanderia fulva]